MYLHMNLHKEVLNNIDWSIIVVKSYSLKEQGSELVKMIKELPAIIKRRMSMPISFSTSLGYCRTNKLYYVDVNRLLAANILIFW